LCDQFATQGFDRNPVDESTLTVDFDDGKPLAVGRLKFGVAGDVDLSIIDALSVENPAGALAKVAPLRDVKDHALPHC
jgi:hypothetical protein